MSDKLRRHWKFILPIVAVGIVIVGFSVGGMMKGSEAYAMAMDTVRQSDAAKQLLGEPIEDGFLPQGSIQTSGPSGQAEMAIPVSGNRAAGTLYVRAVKEDGAWRVLSLILQTEAERLDLLAGTGGNRAD